MSHTKGPWFACDPGDYSDLDGRSIVILGDDRRLVVVHGDDEESIDTARLIAVAPDLLDELREILEWAVKEKAPLRQQEIDSIRKVIAKATGERNV